MFESRAPSAKFHSIGTTYEGDIVDVRRVQETEFKTNIPYYWQDKKRVTNAVDPATRQLNDPKLQYEITIDTGKPDENGETERRIFVGNQRDTAALKTAVKAAGGRDGLLIGGHLKVTYTGDEDTGTAQPAKLKVFQYSPPAAGEGRKPDLTPVLSGQALQDTAAQPYVPVTARTPDFPIAKPYSGTTSPAAASITAPAAQTSVFDEEPPF